MDFNISISVRLLDEALLVKTDEEYEAAVDAGLMTEKEWIENIEALYLGMAVYELA